MSTVDLSKLSNDVLSNADAAMQILYERGDTKTINDMAEQLNDYANSAFQATEPEPRPDAVNTEEMEIAPDPDYIEEMEMDEEAGYTIEDTIEESFDSPSGRATNLFRTIKDTLSKDDPDVDEDLSNDVDKNYNNSLEPVLNTVIDTYLDPQSVAAREQEGVNESIKTTQEKQDDAMDGLNAWGNENGFGPLGDIAKSRELFEQQEEQRQKMDKSAELRDTPSLSR